MKNLFFVSVAFCIFSGTSLSATAQKQINATNYNDGIPANKSFKFIEGIEIKADNTSTIPVETSVPVSKKTVTITSIPHAPGISIDIEKTCSLQFKYAQLLNRNVEDVKNIPLYNFIDEWWETRYCYGGTTKKGIDCSALSGQLMSSVFAIKLPRTARDQYDASLKIDKEEMTEGDLVFFNTRRGVSHVGVYLGDGYFVHASRNNGVTISHLDDPYYYNRFIGAGRVMGNENTAAVNN